MSNRSLHRCATMVEPRLSDMTEQELAQQEAATRAQRAPTDTLMAAVGVFVRAPSVTWVLVFILLSVVRRAFAGVGGWWEWSLWLVVFSGWPLLEWSAHRWILHLRPRRVLGMVVDPYFARRHRQHHRNPAYFPDVFLPWNVVVSAYVSFTVVLWLTGVPEWAASSTMAAISTAALAYEWAHFAAHAEYRPRNRWMRQVIQRHLQHHYRNEQRWYAFTVPAVDDLLGTGGHVRDVPRSATTRDLHTAPGVLPL